MRLINVQSRQLEEFQGRNLGKIFPPYVILSHTWGPEEISFEDLSLGLENAKRKCGYKKFDSACTVALKNGFTHLWMDTCCIDKSSSAELSEAINSMFRWYKRAKICYAYLEDVGSESEDEEQRESAFAKSRWFTRGWTLQELIAPPEIWFFSREWNGLGKRSDLAGALSSATGIDPYILTTGRKALRRTSMAERMSWAAKRETTRPEDIAYCLLGIFDVNMNLLYGEGKTKAFIRLQEEILKRYPDQSMLAWTPKKLHRLGLRGPLALHPKEFEDSANFMPVPFRYRDFAITEMGLQITLNV
ncbi:HET-domain-containing protein, partial [Eremomyces bilateralis CBS 781.70]